MKLSVVIPVCNEADNVGPLAREIQAALADHQPFEIIFVDDGSTDRTVAAVQAARAGGIPRDPAAGALPALRPEQGGLHRRARRRALNGSRPWMATARTTRPTFLN